MSWAAFLESDATKPKGPEPFVPSRLASHHWARLAWIGFLRAVQLIWSIALPWQVVIVTLYWVLLAKPFEQMVDDYRNKEAHGMKLVYLWMDYLLFSSNRLVDRHGLLVFLAAIGYLIWNLAYTFLVGPWVYPVLTWRGAGSAILAIGALAFIMVVYYLIAQPLGVVRDSYAAKFNGTVHMGAACCCYTCGTDAQATDGGARVMAASGAEADASQPKEAVTGAAVEATAVSSPDPWALAYPSTFADDHLAFPCSSCACSWRGRARPGQDAAGANGVVVEPATGLAKAAGKVGNADAQAGTPAEPETTKDLEAGIQ